MLAGAQDMHAGIYDFANGPQHAPAQSRVAFWSCLVARAAEAAFARLFAQVLRRGDVSNGTRPQACDIVTPGAATAGGPLSARLSAQHLNRFLELRIPPGGVGDLEGHFDRRLDAFAFEALAVHLHVIDCDHEEARVG